MRNGKLACQERIQKLANKYIGIISKYFAQDVAEGRPFQTNKSIDAFLTRKNLDVRDEVADAV